MVWNEQWSYQVDGTQLNDHVKFVTMVPEIENSQQRQMITAQVDGDYPVFIRSQPQEGNYTFLIACKNAGNPVIWNTRMAQINALFAPDAVHTFAAQARGMPAPKSTTVIVESITPDYRSKTVTVTTMAPRPILE